MRRLHVQRVSLERRLTLQEEALMLLPPPPMLLRLRAQLLTRAHLLLPVEWRSSGALQIF